MTFDWYPEERQHKKVVLCSADECKDVTGNDVKQWLMGMGLSEWETYMGELFTKAISQAVSQNANTADVTAMFSCDLLGIDKTGEYKKKQRKIITFLMKKFFDKVSENENELIVKVKKELLD